MKTLLMCAALLGAAGLASQAQAEAARAGVQVGALSCHEAAGWGLILGSSHQVSCIFTSGDKQERYEGSISRFGVDVGYQANSVMVWGVIAPTRELGKGVLAGHCGGAQASAAAGVGVGANVLVGGFNRSITLQPVSFVGKTGLHVAAGLGELTLTPKPETKVQAKAAEAKAAAAAATAAALAPHP